MRYFFLLASLSAFAQDSISSAPSLGWSLDSTRHELTRLDGIPGSLRFARLPLPKADRVWLSSALLLSASGDSLNVLDLHTGESRSLPCAPGHEIVFSANGRHFTTYDPAGPAPLVLNDGTPLRDLPLAFTAATESGDQLLLATAENELVTLTREANTWREISRQPLPIPTNLRALEAAADSLYLLTVDGDLLLWSRQAPTATPIASAVRSFQPLLSPGFYRLEDSRGPWLYYPASLGQKLYELPGAKAIVLSEEQR